MQVSVLLADYAQVSDGKLTVVGAGWSITGPQPIPYGIGVVVKVPWDKTNIEHPLRFDLLDSDGNPITVEKEDGEETALFIEHRFTVGRPPELKPGTAIDYVWAFNCAPPPPVSPGGQYQWRVKVDGEESEAWNQTFTVRPLPPAIAA